MPVLTTLSTTALMIKPGLFQDLIAYLIVTENNAGQYYPDYAYEHPLFTKGMRQYSDSTVSEFLNTRTVDESTAFQNAWNALRDHRERTDVINREISLCGYIAIITSEKMTAREALLLYKSRDGSEKLFRGDKSYLGN